MSKAKHTNKQLRYRPDFINLPAKFFVIESIDDEIAIASTEGCTEDTILSKANAARLVLYWNSHDALVEACEKALKRSCGCYNNKREDYHTKECAVPLMRAALKLAKGEK
jgi:hypothetical protein